MSIARLSMHCRVRSGVQINAARSSASSKSLQCIRAATLIDSYLSLVSGSIMPGACLLVTVIHVVPEIGDQVP